jgi:hypothetical protein
MQANLEQCPLCSTELSQTKFREIRAKLREEEDRKAAEIAQAKLAATKEIEEEFRKKLEQEGKAAEKRGRAEADKQLQRMVAERDGLTEKLQAAQEREIEIRKQAQVEGEKQKQITEKRVKAELEVQLKNLALQRDQATKKLKEAEGRESVIRKQAEEKAEKEWQKQLADQRLALEKDKNLALLKQQAEHNRDRESMQKKLKVMEHQVQKKTANELGDGAEIDLLEGLRNTFPDDRITRTEKGEPGADILHEVLYKGEVCGRIVTDSKKCLAWQSVYVTKLRRDQVEARAEHAILATTVFPAGKKELFIESGVIVVSPQGVVHITELLRQAIITMHTRGLSFRERSNKMSQLYNLITSEPYSKKFGESLRLAQEILDLDVQEKREHENVWRKRGTLATGVKKILRDIEVEVAVITEGFELTNEETTNNARRAAS